MWNCLPEDLKIDCIARVPRCYYPILSIVSKYFQSLIASPELYARRAFLGCTEYCFYVGFANGTAYMKWYTFRKKNSGNMFFPSTNDKWLIPIPFLPSLPARATCFLVVSKIYMIGGNYDSKLTSNVSVINCISHTAQPLPRFRKEVGKMAVGSSHGNIYVIDKFIDPRIMVFNTESLTWRLGERPKVGVGDRVHGSVSMCGKTYMTTDTIGYIYDAYEGKWETDKIMNSDDFGEDACILDNILYSYDCYKPYRLCGYDLKLRSWKYIKDLKGLPQNGATSRITCCDSKLVLFVQTEYNYRAMTDIWCAEIVVGKHEGGEIWGNVEWCDIVLVHSWDLDHCLAFKI